MPPIMGETDYSSIMICNILLFPLTKEKALFFYNKNIHRQPKKRLILSTLEFSDKKRSFQLLSIFFQQTHDNIISKWTTSWVVFLWLSIHPNHYSLFWESLRVMDQVLTTNQYVSMLLVLTIPACGWSPYRNFGSLER